MMQFDREFWGGVLTGLFVGIMNGKGGSGMGKHHGEVANTGPADRGGSELQEKGPAPGNHGYGHSIGERKCRHIR